MNSIDKSEIESINKLYDSPLRSYQMIKENRTPSLKDK